MPDINRQYPIGKFVPQETYTPAEITANIGRIEILPEKIRVIFKELTPALLDTPYREGGWTARQVLHHIPDSHLNAYIRCKWTLTEDTPLIKAYNEKAWAETMETKTDPAVSIDFLEALHKKWVLLLRSLTPEELKRSFIHPETKQQISLGRQIATYAWHGEHHLGHLKLILS